MQHSNVTDDTTLMCNHLLLINTVKCTIPLQKQNKENPKTLTKDLKQALNGSR